MYSGVSQPRLTIGLNYTMTKASSETLGKIDELTLEVPASSPHLGRAQCPITPSAGMSRRPA